MVIANEKVPDREASDDDSARGWYFAYGANMAASVLVTRRKIQPLRAEIVCIKSHALCFNIIGPRSLSWSPP